MLMFVAEEEINITKTELGEVSNNNEAPSSEVRFAMDFDQSPNRANLLDDKPLLQ